MHEGDLSRSSQRMMSMSGIGKLMFRAQCYVWYFLAGRMEYPGKLLKLWTTSS